MTMNKPIRVYIAGLLTPRGVWNSNPAVDYLANVRHMVRAAIDCMMAGLTPFCPGIDYTYFLALRDGEEITEAMIKKVSIEWLEVCDCVLLLDKWWLSPGTLAEIEVATKMGIPVFRSIKEIKEWANAIHQA